jgi:hypothetical protein
MLLLYYLFMEYEADSDVESIVRSICLAREQLCACRFYQTKGIPTTVPVQ